MPNFGEKYLKILSLVDIYLDSHVGVRNFVSDKFRHNTLIVQ